MIWIGIALIPERKAYIWLFPEGYAGWVRVDFEVPGAPPLPDEDGYRVLRVPDTGVIETCDPLITSPATEREFYESDGKRRPAPVRLAGWTRVRDGRLSSFSFHGTKAEWEQAKPPSRDEDPLPGRLPHSK